MTPVTRQLTLPSIPLSLGTPSVSPQDDKSSLFQSVSITSPSTGVAVHELRRGKFSNVLPSARELWAWFFVLHQPSLTHFPNLLWSDKASLLLIKDLVEIACLPARHTWLAVCITSILTASCFAKAEPRTQNN